MPSARFAYPRAARMRRREDFVRLQRRGERGVRTPHFVLIVGPPAPGATRARLGVVVTKKIGHSPARARTKRLCREAFRLGAQDGPWFVEAVEFLVIARDGAPGLRRQDVTAEWHSVLPQLRKIAARQGKSALAPLAE